MRIEIEASLFLFMMNCYKSSFQEICITIIVLKIERTRNQPPYCLLQIQEKMGEKRAFRHPRSGCPGTPLTLPQSLYGRTDGRMDGRTLTSEPKFFGSAGYQICLPMVLRELRYNGPQTSILKPELFSQRLIFWRFNFYKARYSGAD